MTLAVVKNDQPNQKRRKAAQSEHPDREGHKDLAGHVKTFRKRRR